MVLYFYLRLPPEVNRILFVRNLPFKITAEEMYDFVRKIRVGNVQDTRGTAFVVYEDIFDAKAACDHLSGFNITGRYLIVLYYNTSKVVNRKKDTETKEQEIDEMKRKYGIVDD
ncbi:hypothetical protein BJ742DRAFT_747027 [Cladochytrium replicatum]|nr:hypothetical protein BJ742DRAFT_747027 [Cladochytrium replicatum]